MKFYIFVDFMQCFLREAPLRFEMQKIQGDQNSGSRIATFFKSVTRTLWMKFNPDQMR